MANIGQAQVCIRWRPVFRDLDLPPFQNNVGVDPGAVNLLTIEWQLRVKGSNIYHYILYQTLSLIKKTLKKSYLFFKIRFKIFF